MFPSHVILKEIFQLEEEEQISAFLLLTEKHQRPFVRNLSFT